jgi:hypothetical protein
VNAHTSRGSYFRELIRTRIAGYALVLGCIGTFVFGASQGSLLMMVIAPVVVAVVVLVLAAMISNERSADRFFRTYAEGLGLEYVGKWELPCFTPLLGAGNHQWCMRWMIGVVVKEPRLSGGFGYFFHERRPRRDDGQSETARVTERGHFTVCVVDIEQSMSTFKGVFLRQRRGLFELERDWLADTPTHVVELESTAFTQRYELRVSDEQGELLVRELFSPSLVSWLAGHPLTPGFELRAGALVVFVPKLLDDSGNLTFLLDAAREIARRVVREVEEEGGPQPQYLRYGST